jgi:hypothetical protein
MKKLLILLTLLSSLVVGTVYADTTVYLYVFLHDDNTNGERFRVAFPDMASCNESLKNARSPEQKSTGGDYEVAVVMWCGSGDFENQNNFNWVKGSIKQI